MAAVAGLGMFLAALDISVNVALPSIAKGLDADLQSVQWVIVAFVATRAGLVMGAGSFADRFGLRRVFIFGAVSYLVAMVTISLSPNLESVVGFRVLQGFGAGSFFAVSPALAARVFPADRRGLAMGFATGSQALGMLAGTLGAGLLIQWFGWQVVFWGRTPFVLLALLLAVRFMSLDRISRGPGPSGDETRRQVFRRHRRPDPDGRVAVPRYRSAFGPVGRLGFSGSAGAAVPGALAGSRILAHRGPGSLAGAAGMALEEPGLHGVLHQHVLGPLWRLRGVVCLSFLHRRSG